MSRAPWCLGTLMLLRSWVPILRQWRWLTSKGGSNPVCWHKSAFAGATFTAVKEVRPRVWCKGLSLSADVCNPKPMREEPRKCLTACPWVSLHFLLRGVCSVCEWLPPSTPLGGEPAVGRKPLPSPCNTQAWCCIWAGGLHWFLDLHEKN